MFSLIHLLIFRKIFLTPSLSLYKLLWIVIQVGFYYIGMMIISTVDTTLASTFGLQNIFWVMMEGRMLLCGVGCVCICISAEAIRVIIHSLFSKSYSNFYKKIGDVQKQKGHKRVNYEVKLEVID